MTVPRGNSLTSTATSLPFLSFIMNYTLSPGCKASKSSCICYNERIFYIITSFTKAKHLFHGTNYFLKAGLFLFQRYNVSSIYSTNIFILIDYKVYFISSFQLNVSFHNFRGVSQIK